jgi:cellulose synthase/poly-beta-1,6-N-acetylglucosamine synthase-like glycosyltransferase
VRFAEKAWCLTDAPETLRGFVRQRLRWERDALRLRLRKHRRSLDPRDISGSTSELLHQLEFVLTHLGATLAFPLYLIWLLYNFGSGALTVLVVVTLVYTGLDLSAALCALAVVDRVALGRLLPYLPLYGPFHAYLLRTIRLIAYVQEWVFDASRQDQYVPLRVSKKVPFY